MTKRQRFISQQESWKLANRFKLGQQVRLSAAAQENGLTAEALGTLTAKFVRKSGVGMIIVETPNGMIIGPFHPIDWDPIEAPRADAEGGGK